MARKKIALLFGGASKDYYTSLQSASSILDELPQNKYEIIPIGITRAGRWLFYPGNSLEIKDGTWETNPDCCSAVISPDPIHKGILKILEDGDFSLRRVDLIFSVLHGKYGECGKIQSICKLSGIPFVGSDYDSSVLCSDKVLTYLLLDSIGMKTVNYYTLERVQLDKIDFHIEEIEKKFKYPLYVKAASRSRSIGVNRVENSDELCSSIKIAFSHHHRIIIEEELPGREIECVVYGNEYNLKVSEIGEIRNSDEDENVKSFVIAKIDPDLRKEITDKAKTIFKTFGCKDFAGISFKIYNETLYCCRVNNMMGFTREGILATLLEKDGYTYCDMLEMLING